MSDYLDIRQRYSDGLEALQTVHDGRQAQINTAMPATVVSFNPTALTVNVQPSIQAVQINTDGTQSHITIAELHDVPVVFPGGGGHLLTYPIQPGDDCLIIFSQRSIDHWWQLGQLHPPSDWRMHDINDGFALIGVRSLPKVPGGGGNRLFRNAGAPVSTTTVQLRSDDGQMVIDLNPASNTVTITAQKIVLNAGQSITMTSPLIQQNP
jgi:hypothetical protein